MAATLPTYNGWTNKPTWSVNLWLTNDPYTESELRHICNSGTVYEATQALQYFVEDMVLGNEAGSLGGDLIGWSLAYVEWREIVENNREEEEEEDEEEEETGDYAEYDAIMQEEHFAAVLAEENA